MFVQLLCGADLYLEDTCGNLTWLGVVCSSDFNPVKLKLFLLVLSPEIALSILSLIFDAFVFVVSISDIVNSSCACYNLMITI